MKTFIITLFFILISSVEAQSFENQLKQHASPYLAMHGGDPVAWQEWNKQTVARAKKEGKMIFVSSGYFSCHWCHVMQRESYQNAAVAKILNKYFIPVKVDREINSALDSHLIDFVERTQGRAGWPLNVFITPEGYPLVGMTYVPTKNFIAVLNNLQVRWGTDRAALENIAKNATQELSSTVMTSSENIPNGLAKEYIKRFLVQSKARADDMSGGFGQQNKFPSYPQLSLMLVAYEKNPDEDLKQFLLLSLNKMASQGLYDQLGGGFFRYTVDPIWQVPHFEKMLYDNALLASLYLDAARVLGNEKFALVAKDTLNFLLEVFLSNQGAFITSLSALDDKGIEGGYYLWQRDELDKILNKNELQIVELIWQLEGAPELDAGHHLIEVRNVAEAAKTLNLSTALANKYFLSAQKKMLKARAKRQIPRDDKLLGAWNGFALSAFSKAALQFKNKRYAQAAENIKNYIRDNLWIDDALARAVKDHKILGAGALEDYAYVADGLYEWIKYSNNKSDQKWLDEIIQQAWRRFHSNGGWKLSEENLLKYGQNVAVISDGVFPSASATLIHISLEVAKKNNNIALRKKALKALNVGHLEVVSQPFWYATQIKTLYAFQEK